MNKPDVKIGKYQHFKGGIYFVTGVRLFCTNGSNNDRWLVDYQNEAGELFARWVDDFCGLAIDTRYAKTPRFSFIAEG